MPLKIGFAIISHNEPQQLLRLVQTLNEMFSDPPIACHHDFSKCSVDETRFTGNVRFVHPHQVTSWGNIHVCLGALNAFQLLQEQDRPEWFVLLSGSDYPVRSADEVRTELARGGYDAYLDHREILYRALPPGQDAKDWGFGRPEWIELAYNRYRALPLFWWPRPSRKLLLSGAFPLQKRYVFLRNPRLLRRLQPDRPERIYGGDFWFQANANAIDRILDEPLVPELVEYYRKRPNADESLFHTILCNQPDLKICKDHKRYEDWSRDGKHPKWLEISDVPKIAASGAHFARKFRPDDEVGDLLDRTVLGINRKRSRVSHGCVATPRSAIRAGQFPSNQP